MVHRVQLVAVRPARRFHDFMVGRASEERGAWTCKACGFRGFWQGGAHCMGRELEAAFAHLAQRAAALGYPWDDGDDDAE